MATDDNKRFFWLKLNRNFFKQHEIVIVEAMPNGKDYLIFYLKLLAESVAHEGNLRFSDAIPYNEQMLGALTNTNVDIVRTALEVFKSLNMIEILEDGTLYMTETKNMIGSETGKAARMREYRAGLKEQERLQLDNSGATNRLQCSQEIRDKSIEKRIIKESSINTTKEKSRDAQPYRAYIKEVVDYLNEKAGTHYRVEGKSSDFITARLNEHYTVEDLKLVIDKKCKQWLGTEMEKFIRPETLFNKTKFESYLNEKETPKKEEPTLPQKRTGLVL